MLEEGVVVAGRWPQAVPGCPSKPLMVSDKTSIVIETFILNPGTKIIAASSGTKINGYYIRLVNALLSTFMRGFYPIVIR